MSNLCSLEDFTINKQIGKGMFGLVHECTEIATENKYAMKIMSLEMINSHGVTNNVKREIAIQTCLDHNHIIKIHKWFNNDKNLFIISELSELSDLYSYTNGMSKQLKNQDIHNYIKQLLSVLVFLKSKTVVHRDIKPENILMFDDGKSIKLTDFGWCDMLNDENSKIQHTTVTGTLDYVAPEVANLLPHDCKVDLWAVGILLHELLTGRTPFSDKTQVRTLSLIKEGKIDVEFWIDVNKNNPFKLMCFNVLKRLFVPDPEQRITLEECVSIFDSFSEN